MTRHWLWMAGLLALTSCDFDPNAPNNSGPGNCGVVGKVSTVTSQFTGGTEGIAVSDDGSVYVVAKDGLWDLNDGAPVQISPFEGGVGATYWNNEIWVAIWGSAGGELLHLTPGGLAQNTPTTQRKPNFLLPTPWGTLLISDNTDDRIIERDVNGGEHTWASDVPSPNGLALSADGRTLYVASTFKSPGLWAIDVSGGTAGALHQLYDFGNGTAPDGLLLANDGSVLVALNLAGRIDVYKDGEVTTLTDSVLGAASLAWTGPQSCDVYVTNLLGSKVYKVATGLTAP